MEAAKATRVGCWFLHKGGVVSGCWLVFDRVPADERAFAMVLEAAQKMAALAVWCEPFDPRVRGG